MVGYGVVNLETLKEDSNDECQSSEQDIQDQEAKS